MELFDFCILTASSEAQAHQFRGLVERRIEHELYPREIAFRVYADPPAGRCGSGGGTLWAVKQLIDEVGARDALGFLRSQRILLIHAGGESRRVPSFAPEGKVFSPVPVASSSILSPVALDLQLGLFLKFPWRKGELLIASGDVILDFDAGALPEDRGDICGFAKAAPPEQASRHGVFRFDRQAHVVDILQKAPVDQLVQRALIEGTSDCALDIGLVSMSPEAVFALLTFGGHEALGGTVLDGLASGRVRFDLYVEVLTAALRGLTYEGYEERLRERSSLPEPTRRRLFEVLTPFELRGTLTRSSTFIHLGTAAELPQAFRALQDLTPFYEQETGEIRPGSSAESLAFNSVDSQVLVSPSSFVVFEGCRDTRIEQADGQSLFVGLDAFTLDAPVPRNMCIEQRSRDSSPVFVVYSTGDTFKPQPRLSDVVFCGTSLEAWLAERHLAAEDVLGGRAAEPPFDLLDLPLFCAGVGAELVPGYWLPPAASWSDQFRRARRFSLRELNESEDAVARDARREAIRSRLLREALLKQRGWNSVAAVDFRRTFTSGDCPALLRFFERTDDALLKMYRRAMLAELGQEVVFGDVSAPQIDFVDPPHAAPLRPCLKLDQIVWARSPVRLDIAGGWTDTPPFTLRYGGEVTNVAVNLNGQPPIQVFCRRTQEPRIRFHSVDLGLTETIDEFTQLEDFKNPASAFSLPKAALTLVGLRPTSIGFDSLASGLHAAGGGLEVTLLCAVPKGSGLGTSSILGATIMAALHRFFGLETLPAELFRQVLQIEQMLTTGGGWQDQIGGVMGGVKYIESRPGMRPTPLVYQLDPFLFADRTAARCFTLFYTGLTRLAKDILVDVVRRVNGSGRSYLFTLRYMRTLAARARDAVSLRSLAALGSVMSESWTANKRIHPSTTNPDVERLLVRTQQHYSGVKLLGAGGGGYALFVSPTPEAADELRAALEELEDDRARLVGFEINGAGLEVSVS